MKIAILGDSHDHYGNLSKAVTAANERGCELLLHVGDLGAPGNSIDILKRFNGQVKMVLGNNDHEIVGLMRKSAEVANYDLIYESKSGNTYEDTIDNVRIFMHHYPRIAELAAHSGQFDLCIFGHTHTYYEGRVSETLLLNPGSIIPSDGLASLVVFDTVTKTVEKISL